MFASHRLTRLLVFGALLPISFGLAACGSGDDEPTEQEIRKTLAERKAKEDAKAKDALTRLYAVIEAAADDEPGGEAAEFCKLMSRQAQAETINYVESKVKGDEQLECPESVETLYLKSVRGTGKKAPEVLDAQTDGNSGSASIQEGNEIRSIPIVKEDDGWKLGTNPKPGPVGGDATAPQAARDAAEKASSTLLP